MNGGKLSALIDAAILRLEAILPPVRRGLAVLGMAEAEAAEIGSLPAARRVSLVVPRERALLRTVTLPEGSDPSKSVPIWLEEASPWVPGSYLWDVARAGPAGRWQVAMLPLDPVREVEDRLERRGSEIAEIRIGGTEFILRADAPGRLRLRRALVLGTAALTAAGMSVALWQGQMALSAHQIASDAISATAELRTSGANGATTAAALALLSAQQERPRLEAALGFLAERLPLDTWLLHLGLEGSGFTLSGRSAAPEAVIPALTSGTGPLRAKDVVYQGPMARDIQSGLYSFTVSGEFARGAVP